MGPTGGGDNGPKFNPSLSHLLGGSSGGNEFVNCGSGGFNSEGNDSSSEEESDGTEAHVSEYANPGIQKSDEQTSAPRQRLIEVLRKTNGNFVCEKSLDVMSDRVPLETIKEKIRKATTLEELERVCKEYTD